MQKASILDIGGIIVVLVILVVAIFLVAPAYNKFKQKYLETNSSEEEREILEKGSKVLHIFINSIPLITISSGIGAIIFAALIPTHPIFLPASIIALVIYVSLSTIFSNFLYNFLKSSFIVDIANNYPLLVDIVIHLPWIIAGFGAALIIIMYGKAR